MSCPFGTSIRAVGADQHVLTGKRQHVGLTSRCFEGDITRVARMVSLGAVARHPERVLIEPSQGHGLPRHHDGLAIIYVGIFLAVRQGGS